MTSEALLIDRRNEVRWYPMRVTYGREETIRQCLLSDAVENFLPMRHKVYADECGHVRPRLPRTARKSMRQDLTTPPVKDVRNRR